MGAFSNIAGDGEDEANMKIHPAVFEATSSVVGDLYNKGISLSYERAAEILTKYQKACSLASGAFPGARDGKVILRQTQQLLLREGFTPENTLFAQSCCSDEINHGEQDITTLFGNYMGEAFMLGGLAGVPFTGKTGFGAFAAHIPDDGHLFILFAPHVGISESLHIGKFTRAGQVYEGHACGAAIGALNYCIEGKPVPDNASLGANPHDYQMSWIISQIAQVVDEIVALDTENERQAELTRQMYKISKAFLDKMVDVKITDLHGNAVKICLLGGIQINMPRPMPGFFQPLLFQILEYGKPTKDVLEEAFFSSSIDAPAFSAMRESIY